MTPTDSVVPDEVLSLLRFSTFEQTAEGKAGEEGQRSINAQSAVTHGVKIRKEYVIVDVSGRHIKDDPQYAEIAAAMADPTLAGLLVPEQSRLVRPGSFDDYSVLTPFQKHGKFIYTPTARIDPTKPEGRMALTVGGMMSGEELHILAGRFARGKNTKRAQRKHVSGDQSLPKGVHYVREHSIDGKILREYWKCDPLEMDRMRHAFELLFDGKSYDEIAETVGGGWSGNGLRRAMQNPIWIGIRRYEWEATGEEIKQRKDGTPCKPHRKLEKRKKPVFIPTRAELEAGTAQPIIQPILTLAEWDRAQALIEERFGTWKRSKDANIDRDRFLGQGMAHCSCGEALYGKYGSRGGHLDCYICRSRHPRGKGCGMESMKRIDVDAAIEYMVIERLTGAAFVAAILAQLEAAAAQRPDPARAKREEAKAKLEKGRKNLLGALADGEIERSEFREKIAKLESELRALEVLAPPPPPKLDIAAMAQMLLNAFASFDTKPFAEKHGLLRGAVKSIIVDSHARAITTVTIKGGFLGYGAKLVPRSRTSSEFSANIGIIPDLTIHFDVPVEIANTYVDRRGANGHHPNTVATQWRRVQ